MKYQGSEKLDTFISSAAETAKIKKKKMPKQISKNVFDIFLAKILKKL